MFGIGLTELLVILVVALIVIGPDKLPAIARALGKAFSEFKKAGDEIKKSFTEAERDIDASVKKEQAEKRQGAPENNGKGGKE